MIVVISRIQRICNRPMHLNFTHLIEAVLRDDSKLILRNREPM